MHAHGIKVLDGTDDDDVAEVVSEQFQLIFFPAKDALLYQYFVDWRGMQSIGESFVKLVGIIHKAATSTPQGVRRTDNQREANLLRDFFALQE